MPSSREELIATTRIKKWIAVYRANSNSGERTGVSYEGAPLNLSDIEALLDAFATAHADLAARDAVIAEALSVYEHWNWNDFPTKSDEEQFMHVKNILTQSLAATSDDLSWLKEMARNDADYTSGRIDLLEHEKRVVDIETKYPFSAEEATK